MWLKETGSWFLANLCWCLSMLLLTEQWKWFVQCTPFPVLSRYPKQLLLNSYPECYNSLHQFHLCYTLVFNLTFQEKNNLVCCIFDMNGSLFLKCICVKNDLILSSPLLLFKPIYVFHFHVTTNAYVKCETYIICFLFLCPCP